ncbi:hypothetical protein [Georgenia sp. MJ170]
MTVDLVVTAIVLASTATGRVATPVMVAATVPVMARVLVTARG